MRLFSYCIPIDDGAAPNPYWNVCTLAICKPVIRRVAKKGDWVVGVGSNDVNGKDYSGKLVYAMKITIKMSLRDYDKHCKMVFTEKIPDVDHQLYKKKVGDCIYDFDADWQGRLRPSVHSDENRETDLGGVNVLLSEHFYYFGNKAIDIPSKFGLLIRQGQGHQSTKNEPIKNEFIDWIETKYEKNKLYGEPQIKLKFDDLNIRACTIRRKSDMEDERLSYPDDKLPLSHWNYFLALEADLKNISRFVEIHEANFKTFSIGLTQLFLATCSEIDVILKEICRIVSTGKPENINSYYKILEKKVPLLFQKEVSIPLYEIKMKPFEHWQDGQPPRWWTAYNKVKHHRNTNYADANLSNSLNALGALYILIYEYLRVFKGKSDSEFSTNLIYKHLQPAQELFILQDENLWRDIAEGKRSMIGR